MFLVPWSGLVWSRSMYCIRTRLAESRENLLGGSRSTETGNGPGLYERQIICILCSVREWITTPRLPD